MKKASQFLRKDTATADLQHFQILFKAVSTDKEGKVKIKGFASTPDLDRYNDIIKPEAFANAMKTFMKNPRVLLGHDTDKPIGTVVEYDLSDKGLEVTCEILNDTDDCMSKIQNKTLTAFSIGWRCNECVYREEDNKYIREVTSLDLAEISVVAIPANPSTLFTLSKSLKKMFDERKDFENEKKDGEENPEKDVEDVADPEKVKEDEKVEGEKENEEVVVEGEGEKESKIEGEEEQPEKVETAPEKVSDDAPVDNGEPVKAPEKEGDSEKSYAEVKALVEGLVSFAVKKATEQLTAQNAELKKALELLEKKQGDFENAVRGVEVPPSA